MISKVSFGEVKYVERVENGFLILDDTMESNSTSNLIETTVSSILDTTQDPDEHDDDEPIPESEKSDEINDSKKFAKIFTTNFPQELLR